MCASNSLRVRGSAGLGGGGGYLLSRLTGLHLSENPELRAGYDGAQGVRRSSGVGVHALAYWFFPKRYGLTGEGLD